MNGSACYLYALFKRFLVNVKSVVALSAERGDKGRVNVYHLIPERIAYLLVKYCHKACVDNKVSLLFLQSVSHSLAVSGNIGIVTSCENSCLYSVICGSCQCVGIGL